MSQNCVNQIATPGMLIWHCGQASFAGNFTYVGILYNVNGSDGTCVNFTPKNQGNGGCKRNSDNSPNSNTVIRTTGGFGVWGAIAIDNGGCLDIGDNGVQFFFDPNVFKSASSYGSVGLVQTTWRELPPNAAS
jgi:hypothetical protein